MSRPFLVPSIVLIFGVIVILLAVNDVASDRVTCGGTSMHPGDKCHHHSLGRGGSHGHTNSYEEERSSQRAWGWIAVVAGTGMVSGGGAVLFRRARTVRRRRAARPAGAGARTAGGSGTGNGSRPGLGTAGLGAILRRLLRPGPGGRRRWAAARLRRQGHLRADDDGGLRGRRGQYPQAPPRHRGEVRRVPRDGRGAGRPRRGLARVGGDGRGAGEAASGAATTGRTCPRCEGTGTLVPEPCPGCTGEGRVGEERTVSFKLPGDLRHGTRIRLSGQGEAGRRGGPAGDLYVRLHMEADPR